MLCETVRSRLLWGGVTTRKKEREYVGERKELDPIGRAGSGAREHGKRGERALYRGQSAARFSSDGAIFRRARGSFGRTVDAEESVCGTRRVERRRGARVQGRVYLSIYRVWLAGAGMEEKMIANQEHPEEMRE